MTCACGATLAEGAILQGVTMCLACVHKALTNAAPRQRDLFDLNANELADAIAKRPAPAPYFAPIVASLGKCEWCGATATQRLIGTSCCDNCTTRPARLAAARARWDAGRKAMGR